MIEEAFHSGMEKFLELNAFLVPFVEKTVIFKASLLSSFLKPLSEMTGEEDEQILFFVLALFACYPLALCLAAIKNRIVKHFMSFLIGLFFTQTIYGVQWIHSFLSATITYIIVALAPRKNVGFYVLLFTMAYLSVGHIYIMYVRAVEWSMDFTALQMVLTIKFTSFAYNIADGTKEAQLEAKKQIKKDPKAKKMYDLRNQLAIKEMPSFLEYMGYVYCFTTSLAGPAFEFAEYIKVLEAPAIPGLKRASILPALKKLFAGIVLMALHVKGKEFLPSERCASDEMNDKSLLYRFLYMYFSLLFVRCKYYFAWKVAEGSCILAGFGFEGLDNKKEIVGFNGVSNIDIIGFEFAANTVEASRAWNQGTQKWLQRYVYSRFGRSILINYFVSALWHGFYSGYFIFFLSIAVYTNAERLWKVKVKPYFVSDEDNKSFVSSMWNFLGIVIWISYINYFAISFELLSYENAMKVYPKLNFLGHILMVVAIIFCVILPKKKHKTK